VHHLLPVHTIPRVLHSSDQMLRAHDSPRKDGIRRTITLKTYAVVIRCSESLVRLHAERGIRIAPMRSPTATTNSRSCNGREQSPQIKTPIPRELFVEVRGAAPSLEVAINIAVSSASDYARELAFAANASIAVRQLAATSVRVAEGPPRSQRLRRFGLAIGPSGMAET
jgi:hypothetical protein